MMNRTLLTALAILVSAMPAAAQGSEWTPAQREIIDLMSRGPVGIEANFEAWSDNYDSDWSYWRLGEDATRDRGTHMGLVRDFVEAGNRVTDFDFCPVDVQLLDDVAVVRANAREAMVAPDGAERVVFYSTVSVLRRTPEGWRLVSSNLFYPPTSTQDGVPPRCAPSA